MGTGRTRIESFRSKEPNMTPPDNLPFAHSLGLLVLRLGMGGYMLTHGAGKLQMLLDGKAAAFPDPIGIGGPVSLVLVTVAEFLCAILVMAGLLTRWSAVPVVIAMGVAAFVVHGADPWTMQAAARAFASGASQSWSSKEPALLYLVGFLALAIAGGGGYSVDAWIRRRRWDRR